MAPPALVYAIPAMQLVCNLVMPGVTLVNDTNSGIAVGDEATWPIPPQTVNLPDGYIPHLAIGAAYKVYTESVTWKVARENCIREGARLAVTEDFIRLEYVLNQMEPDSNGVHVGVHPMYDRTEWVSSTTGDTLWSLPWSSNHPFGASTCVVAGFIPRGLRNVGCSSELGYACEIPISRN